MEGVIRTTTVNLTTLLPLGKTNKPTTSTISKGQTTLTWRNHPNLSWGNNKKIQLSATTTTTPITNGEETELGRSIGITRNKYGSVPK